MQIKTPSYGASYEFSLFINQLELYRVHINAISTTYSTQKFMILWYHNAFSFGDILYAT